MFKKNSIMMLAMSQNIFTHETSSEYKKEILFCYDFIFCAGYLRNAF